MLPKMNWYWAGFWLLLCATVANADRPCDIPEPISQQDIPIAKTVVSLTSLPPAVHDAVLKSVPKGFKVSTIVKTKIAPQPAVNDYLVYHSNSDTYQYQAELDYRLLIVQQMASGPPKVYTVRRDDPQSGPVAYVTGDDTIVVARHPSGNSYVKTAGFARGNCWWNIVYWDKNGFIAKRTENQGDVPFRLTVKPASTDAPRFEKVETCSLVVSRGDYIQRSNFSPGDQICLYAELSNVGKDGRINALLSFTLVTPEGNEYRRRTVKLTRESQNWDGANWIYFEIPPHANSGKYTARVEIQDYLTGKSSGKSTEFMVEARAKQFPKAPERPGSTTGPKKLADPASLNEKAPGKYLARLDTSKGEIIIEVTRAWAPAGADRFYNLIKHGYYDDCRFFRVVPGFIVQVGINGDPNLNAVWQQARIQDDKVSQSNSRGYVTFATAGPNTRTTQVFINLGDAPSLDRQGFAPFGKVVQGMNVVDSFYSGYGESPNQNSIQIQGNTYLAQSFPNLDFIKSALLLNAESVPSPAPSTAAQPGSGGADAVYYDICDQYESAKVVNVERLNQEISRVKSRVLTAVFGSRLKDGSINPEIASIFHGSFTAARAVQTAYLIRLNEISASHAENWGTKRLAVFTGQQLVTQCDPGDFNTILKVSDLNQDGMNELLLLGYAMQHGVTSSWAKIVDIPGGKLRVLKEFHFGSDDKNGPAVILMSRSAAGQWPNFQVRYQSGCPNAPPGP